MGYGKSLDIPVNCYACGLIINTPEEDFLHCFEGCKEDYCLDCKQKISFQQFQEILSGLDEIFKKKFVQ